MSQIALDMRPNEAMPRRSSPSGQDGPVIVSANSSWNILNFRAALIRRLIDVGNEVVVVAPDEGQRSQIEALGAKFIPIEVDSAGLGPLQDFRLLLSYRKIFRSVRPAAFLGFTAKPNIYGSIAATGFSIRVINNISGLGTAFIRPGFLQTLVSCLYRVALRQSSTVFFQNSDDACLFQARKLVRSAQVRLLPGSGVDLQRFSPVARVGQGERVRFLLVARMLRDKGIIEFVDAARTLRREGRNVSFSLLGAAGSNNRTAISAAELAEWVEEGVVQYLGETDDVRPFLADADCVVLPSYREGLPRSLLEAAAMAKPIIASDVPGCRQVVENGITGLLCEPRNSDSLAIAMRRLQAMTADERRAMGAAGRRKAEQEYSEDLVLSAYCAALDR